MRKYLYLIAAMGLFVACQHLLVHMVTQKGHRYKHNYAYNMLESVELPLLRLYLPLQTGAFFCN